VALGMIAAARLAVRMGILKVEEEREIVNLIDLAGLPTMLAGIEAEKVVAAMGTDKKVAGGKVRFILPTGIGSAEVVSEVKGEDVKWATGTLGEPACEWEG